MSTRTRNNSTGKAEQLKLPRAPETKAERRRRLLGGKRSLPGNVRTFTRETFQEATRLATAERDPNG